MLHEVTLTIPAHKMVALVGQSGSGKTTLVNLLLRFYQPKEGRILLDGKDVADYQLDDYRRQFAFVTQDTILFNDTVANNIAYGESSIHHERLQAAAKAAHATDFIEMLPQGFDTVIAEDGSSLSGGQRQRLALARAIYHDAKILVLDEATSSLDAESERHIQEALNNVLHGRTAIVIAHRLATIIQADKIIVMHEGAVVEQGTHDELLALDGYYARLYTMQFKGT